MKRNQPAGKAAAARQKARSASQNFSASLPVIDRHRAIVFPNHLRQERKRAGFPKLLGLAQIVPDIPYIRLSKIERGEVFAKPAELVAIAKALKIRPVDLLIDIDDPEFDIAAWAADIHDPATYDAEEDAFAVLLAAALRAEREDDPRLSIATLENEYGIAPVILSRLENAYKTIDRWNEDTLAALCRIFQVGNVATLRKAVANAHATGALARHVDQIAHPDLRIAKSRARIAALREALATRPRHASKSPPPRRSEAAAMPAAAPADGPAVHAADMATVRLVPVFGTPLGDGLIARTPIGITVEAPRNAGPRAYGLRVCRPSLGPGLPGGATVIVDPDRFPSSGGIGVVQEPEGLRLLMVTFGRDGRMIGYSEHPDREIAIDEIDPADVATVIAAIFE